MALEVHARGIDLKRVGVVRVGVVLLVTAALVALSILSRLWSSSAPPPQGTQVTPVALPTFGADAPQNVLEATAPEILTPTPGVSGPTPVVITQSPWKVLIAHSVIPDMTSPSGVA